MADRNGKRAGGLGIRRRDYYRVTFSRLSAFCADARARVVVCRATLVALESNSAQLACLAFFRRGRTGHSSNRTKRSERDRTLDRHGAEAQAGSTGGEQRRPPPRPCAGRQPHANLGQETRAGTSAGSSTGAQRN